MSHLRRSARLLIAATSGTALLATSACSGSSGPASAGDVVSDATFTLAINADPGSLNPLGSNLAGVQQLAAFLYDPLVHDEDGKVTAGLASSWELTDSGATFTMRDDVTCSDGTPLTGQDVIDTINYVGDTKNASPLAGSLIPAGTTAAAGPDDTQVTVSTPEPYGFLLNGLAGLPIVCASGLKDLDELGTSASGSGPYTLESVSAGSRYELQRRDDYAWGQDGVTGKTKGLPAKIVVQVVPNETTAANQLLAGDLDAATIAGADRKRLEAADLEPEASSFVFGELEYNQKTGRPTADPAVRVALTQALNLDELRQVATSGTGSTPTRLSGVSPCGDGGVADALPKQDVEAAKAALGPVSGTTLSFLYLSKLGPAVAAAAELAVEQWKAAGVTVEARGLSDAQLLKAAYETGDFDIAWIPIDGQNPAQIAPSFSGPTPADGGGNFASIDNATYAELAAKAGALPTEEACPIWEDAEEALVSAADVVPFAFSDYPIWAAKTTSFEVNYFGVVPSSIRMYG